MGRALKYEFCVATDVKGSGLALPGQTAYYILPKGDFLRVKNVWLASVRKAPYVEDIAAVEHVTGNLYSSHSSICDLEDSGLAFSESMQNEVDKDKAITVRELMKHLVVTARLNSTNEVEVETFFRGELLCTSTTSPLN